MTSPTPTQPKKSLYPFGIILIIISATIFSIPLFSSTDGSQMFGLFLLNFIFTIIYFVSIWVGGSFKKGSGGITNTFLFLVLFLISAYSLNRCLPIFELSVPWFSAALTIICITYMTLRFFERMAAVLQHVVLALLGVASIVFFYLATYLIPIYPFSAIFFFAIGIPLHSFVPLMFLILTMVYVIRLVRSNRRYAYSFSGGIVLSLLIATIFTIQWNGINDVVRKNYQRSLIADNTDLPPWIKVAQSLPKNDITEKYLKSELVYTVPSETERWTFFAIPQGDFDEVRKHDPLIMFACLFSRRPDISEQERIKILEAMYNSRHKTLDRLWSGDNLHTQYIISNIRLWPELRMAYTEKTISVANTDLSDRNWRSSEEAIYTFHLPEGGVVSSLSLWVNGKEEKGILTTSGKADSAYKDIVGVQRRDPSLVHWQEGNTVSVRVFPVLSGENRIVKLGITSPLTKENDKLRYEDIYFEGPKANGTKETVQIDWVTEPKDIDMEGFEKSGNHRYIRERTYQPGWDISFTDQGLKQNSFAFDGAIYSVSNYSPGRQQVDFQNVYIDLNNSWTDEELKEIRQVTAGKNIFIFNSELINLNTKNNDNIIQSALDKSFSLFPFYEVKDPAHSLVISKSTTAAPDIRSLKETDFAKKLESSLSGGQRYYLYNIGNELSPYLKTLKEHRIFEYEHGDIALLKELLSKRTFSKSIEDSSHIVIDNAQILLTKNTGNAAKATAPDHLMRLFSYNYLMRELGGKLFTNQESNEQLVAVAQKANIVSPISSLVVLETQADYDKFDIKKSKNSLDNASLNNKGAVPEPHEWALLLLVAGLLSWLLFKDRLKARFIK